VSKKLVPDLESLSAESLQTLDSELVGLFNSARAEELTVEKTIELSEIASAIDEVRAETGRRAELQARTRADAAAKVEALAARVAAVEAPAAEEAAVEAPAETELAAKKGKDDDEFTAKTDTGGAGNEDDEAEKDDFEELASKSVEELTALSETMTKKADAYAVIGKDKKASEFAEKAKTVTAAIASRGHLSPSQVGGTAPQVAPVPAGDSSWGTPSIVASADIPGYSAGNTVENMLDVAHMMVARHNGIRSTSSTSDGDKVMVASIHGAFPDSRKLSDANALENMSKIDAVASPQAITASGGVCAPGEPYYGLLNVSSVDRPVKASLPTFMADRGSIVFIPPPVISQLAGSVSITSEQQDASGYAGGGKNVLHVTCAAQQQVYVTAISRILEFGNFGARTFPEQVEIWTNLSIAQTARQADGFLLTQMQAASTQVTAAQTFGVSRQILAQIDQAAAAQRSRNRMDPQAVLRFMAPYWIKNIFRADIARTYTTDINEQFSITDAQIDAWFAVRNIAPTYYLDQATGGGQIFGAQSAGALLTFPSTIEWLLFPEGSFLHLDAGTLDLGLVRDSTLNSTNDYEIFAELFENIAFVGVESLFVTSTVCASGSYAPAGSALSCPV
jgi:hypothetical protein